MTSLLDTSVVIDYLNNRPSAVQALKMRFAEGLGVSTVTVAEYLHGVYASARPEENLRQFDGFLSDSGVVIFDVDRRVAERYGKEQGYLERRGQLLSGLDLLIAATALVHNLTLVTTDRAFERVRGLRVSIL